ncbi:MAG: hypothetical protein H6Q66_2855 [Firmicutes bacterium]|nr:hypothetical protein [Bacillota bacterium]
MKVLLAAAEAVPFVKTGGLADVVGSLPQELRRQGIDARVILPLYRDIPEIFLAKMTHVLASTVSLGWRRQYCGLLQMVYQEVPFYFIDNEYYFARDGLYGYKDDAERFAFFSKAIVELLPHLGFMPDIIHSNDWHTGLVGAYLHAGRAQAGKIASLFTIHNLRYQGVYPHFVLHDIVGLDDRYFTPERLEFFGAINYMKAGISFADIISTVSVTYAKEIQTVEYGEKLDGFLQRRSHDLVGIVNGIDYTLYNPEQDSAISSLYSAREQAGKKENKAELQKIMGFPVDERLPLIAIVSRLVDQKGLDLVLDALPEILNQDIQFVVLGTGDEYYERSFSTAAKDFPQKMAVNIQFSESLAHKIYAGSDIFLMPSCSEPCGIGQLIAMRYGAVPVVRAIGGLKDTVQQYDEATGSGTGFCFAEYSPAAMLTALRQAITVFRNKAAWMKLMRSGMKRDFSWKHSAAQYKKIYEKLWEVRQADA